MGGSHWSVTDCPPEPAGDRRGVPAAESRGSAPAAQADSGRTDGAALLGCVATELPGWRGQLQARATRPAGGTGVRSAPGEAVPRPLPVSHTVKEAPGPPARKSAGRGPAPGFPLQRPACPSRPLRPVPRVATQQTRGLARAPPGPDQGHAEREAPWPHVCAGSFQRWTTPGAPATRGSRQAAPRPPQEPCRSHPRGARQSEAQVPPRQGGEGRSGRGGLADAHQQV